MVDEVVDEVADFWVEEPGLDDSLGFWGKAKRKARSKKMEFVGWGSEPLITFLQSIGKDTSKEISHFEVTSIINEYVKTNNLTNPLKKKRIQCDEKLHSLFGKKSLPRIKIHDFLEKHFAENQDESDDDFLYSSEDNDEMVGKRPKTSNLDSKNLQPKKKIQKTPKSCYAAVIPANIKLLYLKRTLVQDLQRDDETFECKLVGSFVRVKTDPNDYLQKNSHQLLQVIGLKRPSGAENTFSEILLQVSNMIDDIRICMLSDDNFSEEECEDLRERIKNGSLKRPTVVDFQEKAELLHEDITKHWLVRELRLLQNLIDRANEKGWRKEFFEYLDRKEELQKPSEQKRLLLEVPKVIAEELEHEAKLEMENNDSPRSVVMGASLVSTDDSEATETLPAKDVNNDKAPENQQLAQFVEQKNTAQSKKDIVAAAATEATATATTTCSVEPHLQKKDEKVLATTQIVELSDDDNDEEPTITGWHYVDPRGKVQGPFSVDTLRQWSEANYFPSDFKVFQMLGQDRAHEPVLLSHLLRP